MTTKTPVAVHIFAYQVGFGDCFLVRFRYAVGPSRHILIDFGSMGMRKGTAAADWMLKIANDIADKCEGKLDAVIATHRHADHISGFATNKTGTASGNIIASLTPSVVVQPWTEQLDLAEDAVAPNVAHSAKARSAALALRSMNAVAGSALALVSAKGHGLAPALAARLGFLGEDNISNLSAVKNLAAMGPNVYTFHGASDPLSKVLPGIKTHVLGPPTVEQTDSIKKMRSRDPDEYWHFQRMRMATEVATSQDTDEPFPAARSIRGTRLPMSTRWVAKRVRDVRGSQLLQIVTSLDKAMNNTSLILLFEVGKKKLLFPGDAQIENWRYALSFPKIVKQLTEVDVLKVGHHGSLNATPKSLWGAFAKKGTTATPNRLKTVLSTMPGKHGDEARKTEVPRTTLVNDLTEHSELHNTHDLGEGELYKEVVLEI
ncbi:MBL fold metallo-hydrolase [Aquincola sp. S2]|uniref:MBL fold metallo-hydrolase n=1 Tax=Pseudaquabacterium terrae TaxID=2732868 RepID=A0ABX2EU28_9BURK|nr:MBL fold metallo-hydrolase [Aquabacterium terrae]NRF72229.1 MBL fold metallo-hydrolase [Aquabacterium terrae]